MGALVALGGPRALRGRKLLLEVLFRVFAQLVVL